MTSFFKDINKLRILLSQRDKWKFLFLLGLMFVASLLEAIGVGAIPLFVALVINPSALADNRWVGDLFVNLPAESSVQMILVASVVLLSFIVIKNLFIIFVFYIQARITTGQRIRLSSRMFKAYQAAPYEWHLQRSSSELIRNIQDDVIQVISGVIMPLLDLVMSLIMTTFIIVVMVANTPGPTILSLLITGICLFLVIRISQRKLHRTGEIIRSENKGILQAIQQGFSALVDARIIGCEEYLKKMHYKSVARQSKAIMVRQIIHKSIPYTMETVSVVGLLVIFFILMKTSDSIENIFPLLSLLGVATIRLKQMVSKIALSINTINATRAYIPGIITDIKELEELEKQRKKKELPVEKGDGFESLELKKISYIYPATTINAIDDVSIEVKRGESIAFVGPTGCGKTTLVNIILGLLDPQSGTVVVNGRDISSDITNWRTCLGYIPQSVFLIDDTIRANIAFGVSEEDVDEIKLQSIIDLACLTEFVKEQPDGIDTVVGERGIRLSGGQRQRLGIARALYTEPEVLIMDEATSALDNKTESDVMQAIQNMKENRTLIMIAHRLSTVENCDCLYYFSHGSLKGKGTYTELSNSLADFKELTAGLNQA